MHTSFAIDRAQIDAAASHPPQVVPNPDVEGRRQILESYVANLPLAKDVNLGVSGRQQTPEGCTAAGLGLRPRWGGPAEAQADSHSWAKEALCANK